MNLSQARQMGKLHLVPTGNVTHNNHCVLKIGIECQALLQLALFDATEMLFC